MQAYIEIYTDGSCDNSHPETPMGWAAVLRFYDKHGKLGHSKEVTDGGYHGTNNIAELNAVKLALNSLSTNTYPVVIYTDSTYVKGIFEGNEAKVNQELIKEIKALASKFDLTVKHVKGHNKNEKNEQVDSLARTQYRLMLQMLPNFKVLKTAWLEVESDKFAWMRKHMNWNTALSQKQDSLVFVMDDLEANEIPVFDEELAADILSAKDCELMLVSVALDDSKD